MSSSMNHHQPVSTIIIKYVQSSSTCNMYVIRTHHSAQKYVITPWQASCHQYYQSMYHQIRVNSRYRRVCIIKCSSQHGRASSQSIDHNFTVHRDILVHTLVYKYLYIIVCTYHCIHITHTLSSSYHTMQHHIIIIIECKSVSSLYSIHIIIPLYLYNTVHTILVHHHHANIPWTVLQMSCFNCMMSYLNFQVQTLLKLWIICRFWMS